MRSENGCDDYQKLFNVFSYEEEQKNKANTSGWDNWVAGKLEIKEEAVMGER